MSVASVSASFPAMNSRARNGESSASTCENFTFQGQTLWEMCRHNRFEIPLQAGRRTVTRRDRESWDFPAAPHVEPQRSDRFHARLLNSGVDFPG